MRILIVLVMLCTSAQAADPWVPFHKAFPGPSAPVIAVPLPPLLAPTPPIMVPEAQEAIERALLDAELQAAVKRAQEAADKLEEAAKAAAVPQEPPRDPKSPAPKPKAKAKPLNILPGDPDYISCADARRGVTMSCFALRLNAHVYEGYSEKKKAMANACLTSAERARIAACFQ